MNLKLFAAPLEPISPPVESCQGYLSKNASLLGSGVVFPVFLLSLLSGAVLIVSAKPSILSWVNPGLLGLASFGEFLFQCFVPSQSAWKALQQPVAWFPQMWVALGP